MAQRSTKAKTTLPLVAIVMGSKSDLETMRHAAQTLKKLKIPHDVSIHSAHRTPDRLKAYIENMEAGGVKVVIAGAGMAAALPGAIAALTPLPVLGVPPSEPEAPRPPMLGQSPASTNREQGF